MTTTPKRVTVFFSWQSDQSGKEHTNAIRAALKKSAIQLDEIYEADVVIDEATRDVGGAVNIPDTLADKIRKSDVFVADVTTVYASEDGKRHSPNPNVVYELGLAVAHLGWSRIILLTNTTFGDVTDLPFDFDRHRASPFTIKDKADKPGQQALSKLLEKALSAILDENSKRPRELEGMNPSEVKRTRDIENLRWIMSQVSMSAIDNLLERLPDSMMMSGPMMFDGFDEVFNSSSFHIYDEELKKHLKRVHGDWKVAVACPQHYRDASNPRLQIFGHPHRAYTAKELRDRNSIMSARDRLGKSWPRLTGYIREHFLEVNLDETSRLASDRYNRGWADDD